MPPRQQKQSEITKVIDNQPSESFYSRALRELQQLSDMGEQITFEFRTDLLQKAKEKDEEAYQKAKEEQEAFLEASLIETSLDQPNKVITVTCKTCGSKFQTNYRFVKYCSTDCLRSALEIRGLIWDPTKTLLDRWQGLPPQKIQPSTLITLRQWARKLLAPEEEIQSSVEKIVEETWEEKWKLGVSSYSHSAESHTPDEIPQTPVSEEDQFLVQEPRSRDQVSDPFSE